MLTSPDTTSIEQLDFKHVPLCEMVTMFVVPLPFGRYLPLQRLPDVNCPNPADWFLICMHCGDESYVCDTHYRDAHVTACTTCKHRLPGDKARWKRL